MNDQANISNWTNVLNSIQSLAKGYLYSGNLIEANNIYQKAKPLIGSDSNPNFIKASFYQFYGEFLVYQYFYNGISIDTALQVLKRSEKYLEKNDGELYSKILIQKGTGYYYIELFKKDSNYLMARNLFQKASDIALEIQNPLLIAESSFKLGLIEEQSGNSNEALNLYSKAYEIAKNNKFLILQSYAIRHIGFNNQKSENLELALENLLESHDLRIQESWEPGIIFSSISLGELYFSMENYLEAEKFLGDGYKKSQEYNIKLGILLSTLSLGELFKKIGNVACSKECYSESNQVAKELQIKKFIELTNTLLLNS